MAAKKTTAKPRNKASGGSSADATFADAIDTGGPGTAPDPVPDLEMGDGDPSPAVSEGADMAPTVDAGGPPNMPVEDMLALASEPSSATEDEGDMSEGGSAPSFLPEDFADLALPEPGVPDAPPDADDGGSAPLIDPEGILEEDDAEVDLV